MHLYLGLYSRKRLHWFTTRGWGKNERLAISSIHDLLLGFANLLRATQSGMWAGWPQSYLAVSVACCGDIHPVWTESNTKNFKFPSYKSHKFGTSGYIPHFGGTVMTAGDNSLAVLAHLDRLNVALVPMEYINLFTSCCIPNTNR